MIIKWRRFLGALFFRATFLTSIGAIAVYILSCYLLMAIAGEHDLLSFENFFYWLAVTGSTVGYGDLSPITSLGKLFTAIWVIPLGLSVFAFIIAKIGFYLSELTLKGKRGLRMSQMQNHTVIIGWNGSRTLRLIELLKAKSDNAPRSIVLCVNDDMENPLPGSIDFVKVDSFSHEQTMKRANLVDAFSLIIDTPQDDVTLTTALYCRTVNPTIHTTAYFQDESVGKLLRMHCPTVECIPSVDVEMLAKSSVDPGSSFLHKQLLDSTEGMTQYSIDYERENIVLEPLFDHFKHQLSATIIGIKVAGQGAVSVNPDLDHPVCLGDTIYYINERRLSAEECFSFQH